MTEKEFENIKHQAAQDLSELWKECHYNDRAGYFNAKDEILAAVDLSKEQQEEILMIAQERKNNGQID